MYICFVCSNSQFMRIRYFCSFILVFHHFLTFAQQDTVELYTTRAVGIQGDEVKLEVKVNDFENILAFQASLNWDPILLEYMGVSDFGIKDFNENNFGITKVDQGHLRFLWEPIDGIEISKDDSTILFSLTLKILSDQAQDVPIGYVDNVSNPPFHIEFANSDYEILRVSTFDGKVKIVNDLADVVNIESTSNTACENDQPNGRLKADIDGDSTNYIFHWYLGTSITETPDFEGYRINDLEAGNYTLQVQTLAEEIFINSMPAIIANESNPVFVESTTTYNNYCQDGANGSAAVTVTNPENKNLKYYWFHEGDAIDSVQAKFKGANYEGLSAGTYTSWVIDLVSECTATTEAIVQDSLITKESIITQRNDTLYANHDIADWYLENVKIDGGKQYIIPIQPGHYHIEITNDYGCKSTSNDFYYGTTALEDMEYGISIYPNPFVDYLRISNNEDELDFIHILDTKGTLIKEIYAIKNKFIDIYLTDSPQGFYLIRIGKGGIVHSRKVVKILSK